jgi:hypothetical protein
MGGIDKWICGLEGLMTVEGCNAKADALCDCGADLTAELGLLNINVREPTKDDLVHQPGRSVR